MAYRADLEEYINIEVNENSLREEHGLGARKGHGNIAYLKHRNLERQITLWFNWLRDLGPLAKLPVYDDILQYLIVMNARNGTDWSIPELMPALERDFSLIPATIRTMQLNYLRGNFAQQIKKERELMTLGLARLRFSFGTGVDLPQLALAIDTEFDYEEAQAQSAVRSDTLAQYLATIPGQRRDYLHTKFSAKLASIQDGVEEYGGQQNQATLTRLTVLLNDFNRVSWLPPG